MYPGNLSQRFNQTKLSWSWAFVRSWDFHFWKLKLTGKMATGWHYAWCLHWKSFWGQQLSHWKGGVSGENLNYRLSNSTSQTAMGMCLYVFKYVYVAMYACMCEYVFGEALLGIEPRPHACSTPTTPPALTILLFKFNSVTLTLVHLWTFDQI